MKCTKEELLDQISAHFSVIETKLDMELDENGNDYTEANALADFTSLFLWYCNKYKGTDQNLIFEVIDEVASADQLWGEVFFPEPDAIKTYINNGKAGLVLVANDAPIVLIEQLAESERRQEQTEEFLLKAYGPVHDARLALKKHAEVALVNYIILDRTQPNAAPITDNLTRNLNIRNYLQLLVNTLAAFLEDRAGHIAGSDMTIFQNVQMFNGDTYTGIVEKLVEMAKKIFRPSIPFYGHLQEAFSSKMRKDKKSEDNALFIDAYEAYNILTHFNTMLNLQFGKNLAIDRSLPAYTTSIKYFFGEKTDSNITSHRLDDEITWTKEVSKVTQSLIATTPRLSYGTDCRVMDSYISFNDFGSIICLLKDLVYDGNDFLFNDATLSTIGEEKDDGERDNVMYDSYLSTATLNTIKETGSLINTICAIRENPQKYLSAIFEVLANPTLKKSLIGNISSLSLLLPAQWDTIWSIHKGIFGNTDNTPLSINAQCSNIGDYTFLEYITEIADSLYSKSFLLYYRGENGEVHARDMRKSDLADYERQIRHAINVNNSKTWDTYDSTLIKVLDDEKHNIEFTIPDTDIKVNIKYVNPKQIKVTIPAVVRRMLVNSMQSDDPNYDLRSKILDFISKTLGLNIDDLFLAYTNRSEAFSDIFNFACRIKFLLFVSNSVVGNLQSKAVIKATLNPTSSNPAEKEKLEKRQFGNLKINETMRDIDLVPDQDIQVIELIASAKSVIQGTNSSTVVKNGEGNAQSKSNLSSLMGAANSQFYLQNTKNSYSPTRNCSLLTVRGLISGMYTARELYDQNSTTDHTQFSIKEFYSGLFLIDFVDGLMGEKGFKGILGEGKVAFIPSVNADKSTIGRIVSNTSKEVTLKDGSKVMFRNLNQRQFIELISKEFGLHRYQYIDPRTGEEKTVVVPGIYLMMLQNIISDFLKLLNNYSITRVEEAYGIIALRAAQTRRFKNVLDEKGWTVVDELHDLINKYNNLHKNNPIKITDLVHYQVKKSGNTVELVPNLTLLENVRRFSYEANTAAFFLERNIETLQNLIDAGFEVDTLPNERLPLGEMAKTLLEEEELCEALDKLGVPYQLVNELRANHEKLKEAYSRATGFTFTLSSWIDPNTALMYIGKFNVLGNSYNIRNANDILPLRNVLANQVIGYINNIIDNIENDAVLEEYLSKFGITGLNQNQRLALFRRMKQLKETLKGEYLTKKGAFLKCIKGLMSIGAIKFELNPLIKKYNFMDFFVTLEYMICTVGSHICHPAKAEDLLEAEASRYNAQNKRNVSFTATQKLFNLNTLNGIPSQYNVAVTEDIYDTQSTVNGDTVRGIKPFDGGTFCNPFVVVLENNSLGGEKAGVVKKTFVHWYDELTATAGIIKTCSFGMTNDSIRNSEFELRLMYKMTSGAWSDLNGNKWEPRNGIFRDDNNELIKISHPVDIKLNGKYYNIDLKDIEYNPETKTYKIYAREYRPVIKDGKISRPSIMSVEVDGFVSNELLDITHLFANKVDPKTKKEISTYPPRLLAEREYITHRNFAGEEVVDDVIVTGVHIDSNYALWTILGGKDSYTFNGMNTLEASEASIYNVVDFMNSVGIRLVQEGKSVRTQQDFYLPLKHSDIHYNATAGAVKEGAGNINSKDTYYNEVPLNYFKINMYLAGIQLDKEHNADSAELSLMTQVMNACAQGGYTYKEAAELYEGLVYLSQHSTADVLKPLRQWYSESTISNEGLKVAFDTAIVNTVLKAMSKLNLSDTSLINNLASELIEAVRNHLEISSEQIKETLPIDNAAILLLLTSTLSVLLTKDGIKAKIPGVLAILTPSCDKFKLRAGRKLEAIDNNGMIKEDGSEMSREEYLDYLQADAKESNEIILSSEEVDSRTALLRDLQNALFAGYNQLPTHVEKLEYAVQAYHLTNEQIDEVCKYNPVALVSKYLSVYLLKRKKTSEGKGFYEEADVTLDDVKTKAKLFNQKRGLTVDSLINLILAENQVSFSKDTLKSALINLVLSKATDEEIFSTYLDIAVADVHNDSIQKLNIPVAFNWDNLKLDRVYRATRHDGRVESIKLDSVPARRRLRADIKSGKYASVREDVHVGRNLAAQEIWYTASNGTTSERFGLWDLDSVGALFDFKDDMEHLSKGTLIFSDFTTLLFGIKLVSLNQLNDRRPTIFELVVDGLSDEQILHKVLERVLTKSRDPRYRRAVNNRNFDLETAKERNLLAECLNSFKIENGRITCANAYTRDKFNLEVQKNYRVYTRHDMLALSKHGPEFYKDLTVVIDGQEWAVDVSSIKHLAFELGVNKRYLKLFMLEKYDDLHTIETDPEFFVKRILQRLGNTAISPDLFDLELKTTNGLNYYITFTEPEGLTEFTDFNTIRKNGKIFRQTNNDEDLYEMNEGDKIYKTREGVEIIYTQNPLLYINLLQYLLPKISEKYTDTVNFIKAINTCLGGKGKKLYNRVFKSWLESIGLERTKSNTILSTGPATFNFEQAMDLNRNPEGTKMYTEYIENAGHAMHTSFLKALECVVARTPSLSLLSYMAMKIVFFDNSEKNSAYVNTSQIYLQGSDFDVDAASVALYEIADNGILPLWSYYAKLTTPKEMELSMLFPFPTGLELVTKESSDITQAKELFSKYFSTTPRASLISIRDVHSALWYDENKLALIKDLLREVKELNIPTEEGIADLIEWFNTRYPELANIENKAEFIKTFLGYIKLLVDNHNLYLQDLSDRMVDMISKNYDLYNTYKIISDPANYIQAYFSVDATTGPLKKRGDSSRSSDDVKRRYAGDFTNKALSILENLVGKEAIGICAVALKTFFGLTLYNNSVLDAYANISKVSPGEAAQLERRLQRLALGQTNGFYDEERDDFVSYELHNLEEERKKGSNGLPSTKIPEEYHGGEGIEINGKTYYYLANINPSEAFLAEIYKKIAAAQGNTEKVKSLENTLMRLTDAMEKEDAALVESALLSLATDNAKELLLAKLNAGTRVIDMYLYGLAIGMNFDDIADIMMHPLAEKLVKLMDKDGFTEKQGAFDFLSALDYYYIGPENALKSFDMPVLAEDCIGARPGATGFATRVLYVFREQLRDLLKSYTKLPSGNTAIADIDKMKAHEALCAFSIFLHNNVKADGGISIADQKVRILANLKNPFVQGSNPYYMYNRLILFAIEYVYEMNEKDPKEEQTRTRKKMMDVLKNLAILAEGATEMQAVGKFYGCNQGLPSSLYECLAKVQGFSNIFTDRERSKHKRNERSTRLNWYKGEANAAPDAKKVYEYPIDFAKFCLDPEYREFLINKYESYKHTFNVLDAVVNAPHFFQYVKLLGVLDQGMTNVSFKYRYLKEKGFELIKTYRIRSSKEKLNVYRGLDRYVSDQMRRSWMLHDTGQDGRKKGLTIHIPQGVRYIADGKIAIAGPRCTIKLGTPHGDAAFKYYMENYYIPKLKEMFKVHENKFIDDLQADVLTHTATKNPIMYYRLPCNMLPHTNEENSIFTEYKAAFNRIANHRLNDGNGTILDMFFYYGLIAHYGRQNQQSLMPIFADWHNPTLNPNSSIVRFHRFEAEFTSNPELQLDLLLDNTYEILPYILPIENPKFAYRKIILARDPDTMLVRLYARLSKQDEEMGMDMEGYLLNHGLGDYLPIVDLYMDRMVSNYYMFNDNIVISSTNDQEGALLHLLKNGLVMHYVGDKILKMDLTLYMESTDKSFASIKEAYREFINVDLESGAYYLDTQKIPELASLKNEGMLVLGMLNTKHITTLINNIFENCKV